MCITIDETLESLTNEKYKKPCIVLQSKISETLKNFHIKNLGNPGIFPMKHLENP